MEPTQNEQPQMPSQPAAPIETSNRHLIMLIVGLVAIAAIIVVAAYSWYAPSSTEIGEDTIEVQIPVVEDIRSQSDSTETEAIEADLSAQSPDDFDQEINGIFAEMEAELQ